jgi:hypothetical protein
MRKDEVRRRNEEGVRGKKVKRRTEKARRWYERRKKEREE